MKFYENRIINGLLKSGIRNPDPESIEQVLSQDILVVVDEARLATGELWPCIWALASVLERQFSGTVYIKSDPGIRDMNCPIELSDRVVFTNKQISVPYIVGIGKKATGGAIGICGDARGAIVSINSLLPKSVNAHAITCFALAGYLAFALLAKIVGIPEFRQEFCENFIDLGFDCEDASFNTDLSILGLGHVGQASLALLYFIAKNERIKVALLDKDRFERANYSTQILLNESGNWLSKKKARYLAQILSVTSWKILENSTEINWGWTKPFADPSVAIVTFDNFPARRMTLNAGYEWLFEAGIGTTFESPKITWHSIPGSKTYQHLFANRRDLESQSTEHDISAFLDGILDNCGWLIYQGISASAPSMGLLAAARLWSEFLRQERPGDSRMGVKGSCYLWSPGIPAYREEFQLD